MSAEESLFRIARDLESVDWKKAARRIFMALICGIALIYFFKAALTVLFP